MVGKRGRPIRSVIRQNMIEILAVKGPMYGYDLHKAYKHIFPPVTRESIYYHLKKGVILGEFEVESVRKEEGDYSWGRSVEKTYYKLGKSAKAAGKKEIVEFFKGKV